MHIEPFYLFLVDDDRKIFNVIGPISDDRVWIDRCAEAQRSGRTVRCFSAPAQQPEHVVASQYVRQLGYQHVQQLVY